MLQEVTILHVAAAELDAKLIREALAHDGLVADVERVDTEAAYVAALDRGHFDLILADDSLSSFDGLSALRIARARNPEVPVILVSGTPGEELAIESLKSGATDYVLKERLQRLPLSVRRALQEVRERSERRKAMGALRDSEADYRLLFERNPLPMWVYDLETLAFLDVNDAAIAHYGYSREEFLGMAMKDIRPPEDIPALLESLSTGQGGLDRVGRWRHQKKDGSIIAVEITAHLIGFSGRRAELVLAHDITERELAQETASKLAAIVESSDDAIIGNTLNGIITSWNHGAEKLYGYSAEEVIGSSIAILVPAVPSDDVPAISEGLKRGESIDQYGIKKDGKPIWVSLTVSLITDKSGRVIGASTIARDITARKQAEEARQTSEIRYRRLFESAKDGILILDGDSGQILDVNPFLAEMLAFSKEELMGKALWEIGVFGDEVASKSAFIQLKERGYIRYENLPLETRDGQVRQVEFVSNRYLAGQSRVIQCNIRDITERKQAEDQLHLQGAALESAANAIMITDEKGKIIWVNSAFTQTTGYSMDEVLGKNPRLLKSGKQDRAFYQDMWDTILSGKVWRHTIINRCKDGTLNHADLTITPIRNTTGKITHFVGIKQDITQLEQALSAVQAKSEELTAMTQQLWQASKLATMGELAASVAHELNNPLATVALHAESLMEELPESDPKRRGLGIISQEVERMATLVRNLLQFSRRSHHQLSSIDLPEELENSLNFIEYHMRSRHIKTVQDFASDLPTVQADRQQLRQVFLNLMTNASDAMPNGGTLTVRVFSGVLAADRAAVIVEFSDTGTGIKTGDLPKLWEPFFTTKPEGKGTGLGLAICRRTVEEHHGTIEIETSPGRGTTVRIALPATGEEVAAAA